MRLTFICPNEGCSLHNKPRSVPLLHLGQGLYQWADVLCVCGNFTKVMKFPEGSSAQDPSTGGSSPSRAERFTDTWPR